MITGFNTDVEYEGRLYHVQSEDRGRDQPTLESLVYCRGEIVASRRSSYGDIARSGEFTESEVQRRLEMQHQAVIREVLSGRFDPEGPKPFGYNIITNRSLDEVILDYLTTQFGLERIQLEMEGQPTLLEGSNPTLQLRVLADASDRPVAGASIVVKLLTSHDKPRVLFTGTTSADGRVEATLELPTLGSGGAVVLCQAQAGGNNAELKQLVLKAEAPSVTEP